MDEMNVFKKIMKWIGITLLILSILLILLTILNVITFVSVFDWVQHGIYNVTGLNSALAKAIAAIIVALVATLPLGTIIKSFTPLPQKNKGVYRSIIFVIIAVVWLFVYFGGKNTFFDPKTGEPIKYYVQYPNGDYKFSNDPGYDPLTGEKFKPVTKSIIIETKKLKPVYVETARPKPVITQPTVKPVITQPTVKPVVIKKKSVKHISSAIQKESTVQYEKPATQVDYAPSPNSSVNQVFEQKYKTGLEEITSNAPETKAIKTIKQPISKPSYNLSLVKFCSYAKGTTILYNSNLKELSRIPPESDLEADMKPGKYYLRYENGGWIEFYVSNNKSLEVIIKE